MEAKRTKRQISVWLSIALLGCFFIGFPQESAAASPVTIRVKTVAQLMAAQSQLKKGNCQIIIEAGDYLMPQGLWISGNNVTIRSASGKRESVILRGDFKTSHIFWVAADKVTIQDLTLGQVNNHGVQIHGELDADETVLKNLRFFDIREQMVKGSGSKTSSYSDRGIIENCLFEFTAGKAYQYYTGGIDIHHGNGWIIRGNTFRNIISPEDELSEGAVHMRSNSRNTAIINNQIINCDRGIMLGFDEESHFGGQVVNNMVHVVRDTGIYLCNCVDGKVYNNTVYVASSYPNAIEYRFPGTQNTAIKNNLTNAKITRRDRGNATFSNNVTAATKEWFVDAAQGDLHLKSPQAAVTGKALDLTEAGLDIDGQKRPLGKSDIGADQYYRNP